MDKEYAGRQFGAMVYHLLHAKDVIVKIIPFLESEVDKRAAHRILTDLAWATENCSVISKHCNGEALEDNMGIGPDRTTDIALWWYKNKLSPLVREHIANEYEKCVLAVRKGPPEASLEERDAVQEPGEGRQDKRDDSSDRPA
jgi:hypothetical protein